MSTCKLFLVAIDLFVRLWFYLFKLLQNVQREVCFREGDRKGSGGVQ